MPSLVTLTTFAGAVFNKAMAPALPADPFDASPQQVLTIPRPAPRNAPLGALPHLDLSPFASLAGEGASEAAPSNPLSILTFNISVIGGGTFTYISALPPQGCEPEVNGTYVDLRNITYTSTEAVCGDDQHATVGLYMIGTDVYLLRPGDLSANDLLHRCTNITGYNGSEPPLIAHYNVFENAVHCSVAPTPAPTATRDLPQFTRPRSAWLEVLPKVGAVATGLVALAVCGCFVNRRLQARHVHAAEAHAPVSELEMVVVTSRPEADALTAPID